jgi:hypothetical protein
MHEKYWKLRRVVWWMFIDVSGVLTASIISAASWLLKQAVHIVTILDWGVKQEHVHNQQGDIKSVFYTFHVSCIVSTVCYTL